MCHFIVAGCDEIVSRVHTPDGIAIDWVAKKMYWTDGGYNLIEVAELNGSNRLTLFSSGLDEPRAIVVDPFYGYVIINSIVDNIENKFTAHSVTNSSSWISLFLTCSFESGYKSRVFFFNLTDSLR